MNNNALTSVQIILLTPLVVADVILITQLIWELSVIVVVSLRL